MSSAGNSGPSTAAAGVTFVLVILLYTGGYITLTKPMSILPEFVDEVPETAIDVKGPAPRRYVRFPLGLTASIPKFGNTIVIEIGLAVHEDLSQSVVDRIEDDPAPITAPLSQALSKASEDPSVFDLSTLQATLPGYLRTALNASLGVEKLPEPIYEVYILKMVSAPY